MFALQTARLRLRDMVEADTPLIRRLAQEPAVTRYQSLLELDSEAKIGEWVQNIMFHNNQQPRHAYNLVIEERDTSEGLGWIGWGDAEDRTYGEYGFGYALLPMYWGCGYMAEALRAGLDFMFAALGAQTVSDYCDTTNVGSRRVMGKRVCDW